MWKLPVKLSEAEFHVKEREPSKNQHCEVGNKKRPWKQDGLRKISFQITKLVLLSPLTDAADDDDDYLPPPLA